MGRVLWATFSSCGDTRGGEPATTENRVLLPAAIVVVMVAGMLAWSGVWRYGLSPFGISSAGMTAEKLGFDVHDRADIERVDGVCRAFSGGFNTMMSRPSRNAWVGFVERQPVLYRPFAAEGAAMGFPLRTLGLCSPRRFERELVTPHAGYRYLQYVGLGFWYAMRGREPAWCARRIAGLDPLHGMLCWDGYGFKFGFFDYKNRSRWSDRFERIPEYGRNVAHQGMGRSLWFRYMGAPQSLIENVGAFGRFAPDVAAGVGLAVVFTTMDCPERGLSLLEMMPDAWHDEILLGMCFAYKARSINDPEYFEQTTSALDENRRKAVASAIARCDAIEAEVRADGQGDGYRRWREGVRRWLNDNVDYPFSKLTVAGPVGSGRELTRV